MGNTKVHRSFKCYHNFGPFILPILNTVIKQLVFLQPRIIDVGPSVLPSVFYTKMDRDIKTSEQRPT